MKIMVISEKIKYGCVIFADFFGWLNIINKEVIDQYVFKCRHTDKYKPMKNNTTKIDSENSQNSEISVNNGANKISKDDENKHIIRGKLGNENLIVKYKDAIDKLEAYQAKEPDITKRNATSKLISEYRAKIREAAWDSPIERTNALEDLIKELSGVIENASDVTTVSGVIADISQVVSGVSTLLNEG